MKKKNIIAILAAATICPMAGADELNQTISIEKEEEVVEMKADKMPTEPNAVEATVDSVRLEFSDRTVPVSVAPAILVRKPVRQADGFSFSTDNRGYAEFGMGNYLNMNGSAGYRFVDNGYTKLGAWLQHNSTNGTIASSKKYFVEDRIAVDLQHRIAAKGILTATAGYHFDKFNYYYYEKNLLPLPDKRQTTNEASVDLKWTSWTSRDFSYKVGGTYNFFGNKLPFWDFIQESGQKGLKEHYFSVFGGIEAEMFSDSRLGIDLAYQQAIYTNALREAPYRFEDALRSTSNSLVTIAPYYLKQTETTELKIGARLDFSNRGTTFRIAPDVRFSHVFSSRFGVELSATGGNTLNTMTEIASRNRYLNPSAVPHPNSYTLVDATARFNFGLWNGFSASPYVGFAVVKNALVPYVYGEFRFPIDDNWLYVLPDAIAGTVSYVGHDMNGVRAGVDFTYKFHEKVELRAGYMFTPQGVESGYISADDRPEHTVEASLRVTPIKQLDLYAGYSFRSGRVVMGKFVTVDETSVLTEYSNGSLGAVSDFSFGATYRINRMFHVYAEGYNLFNRRWQDYLGMYSQKANFIVGVGVKF